MTTTLYLKDGTYIVRRWAMVGRMSRLLYTDGAARLQWESKGKHDWQRQVESAGLLPYERLKPTIQYNDNDPRLDWIEFAIIGGVLERDNAPN